MVDKRVNVITTLIDRFTKPSRKVNQSLKQLERNTQAYHNVAANANIPLKKAKEYFQQNHLMMKNNSTAVNTLTGKTVSLNKVTKNLNTQKERLNTASERLNMNQRQITKTMGKVNLTFNQGGNFMDTLTHNTVSQGEAFKRMGKHARSFRFEFLGIMFAGMALSRVFGGLIKSQMQVFGVSDLLGDMWTVVLLPVMESLLPVILKFVEFMMNLPKGAKIAIGVFVVFAAILGAFLMVIGQITLGVMALGKVLGVSGLGGVVKAVGGFFTGLSSVVLAVIGVILAAVWGFYVAWKENWLGAREILSNIIESIKGMWEATKQFFKGILQVIHGIFTGNWEEIMDGIENIVKGFTKWIYNYFILVVNTIIGIVIGLISFFRWLIEKIIEVFHWLYDELVGHSIIPDLVNDIIDWFKKLPSKIVGAFKSLARKIASALERIIPDWMMDIFKRGINIGGDIGRGIGGLLGSFQTGGVVPQTGPYMLHAGETVVPTGQGNNGNINLTVNANVNNDMDIRDLAKKLNRYVSSEFQRNSLGGTI